MNKGVRWQSACDRILLLLISSLFVSGCLRGYGLGPPIDTPYADLVSRASGLQEILELETPDGLARLALASREDGAILFSTLDGPQGQVWEWVRDREWHAIGGDRLRAGFTGVGLLDGGIIRQEMLDSVTVRFLCRLRTISARGYGYELDMTRTVRLLDRAASSRAARLRLPDNVQVMGYESVTVFRNPGPQPWSYDDGVPYIRIEGTFSASKEAVLLFKLAGENLHAFDPDNELLPYLSQEGNLVALTGPPSPRMGFLPSDATWPRLALLDPSTRRLTLILYSRPLHLEPVRLSAPNESAQPAIYWSPQRGALVRIAILTASPALPLAVGGYSRHHRQTIHVRGDLPILHQIAAQFLGVPGSAVRMALAERSNP